MEEIKEYLENRLKVLNFELGYFEDDDENNNLASAKSTKQEIDEVNNLLILFGVSKSLPSDIEVGKAISELSDIADKEAER